MYTVVYSTSKREGEKQLSDYSSARGFFLGRGFPSSTGSFAFLGFALGLGSPSAAPSAFLTFFFFLADLTRSRSPLATEAASSSEFSEAEEGDPSSDDDA